MRDCSFCFKPVAWAKVLRDKRVMCPPCERIEFIRSYIKLGGDYSGQQFEPLPWFKEAIVNVYGPRTAEGLREVEDVFTEVTKGSGKTASVAALGVTELCLIKTTGSEIYSAATAKTQAANTFRAAEQMVYSDSMLQRMLKVVPSTKRIYRRDDPTSFYAALSSDGNVHDGLAPYMAILDELHLWKTKRNITLFEVLVRSARTKRKNPLIWKITTAGRRDEAELCWREHEYCLRWMDGSITNKRYFGRIYAADQKRMETEELYWASYEARLLANPAHVDNGGHIKDEVFASMVEEARTDPAKRNEYCRYHLNYWNVDDESVIDYPTWMKCDGGVDLRTWPTYDVGYLVEKWGLRDNPCYLGLDFGSTADLTALVAGFPPHGKRKEWAFLSWYWMPSDKVEKRSLRDQVPYQEWIEKGFIFTHNEPRTDPLVVLPTIRYCMQTFETRELCYDKWNAAELVKRIEKGDENGYDALELPCWEISQTTTFLTEPTKWLLSAYQNKEIIHGQNPVYGWMARNLGLARDSNANVKPKKPGDDSGKKIDAMSATVTLLRRALLAEAVDTSVNVR